MKPRAAITGYGCVTALGIGRESTWNALVDGKSARGPITVIPIEGCRVREGAQVDLPPIPPLAKRRSVPSRASSLCHPALREALLHSNLLDQSDLCTHKRMEALISTTACGMEKGEAFLRSLWAGQRFGNTERVAQYQAQQQILEFQKRFGFSGPVTIISNACAGGANVVGHAMDLIQTGMVELVLVGGYDALCELVYVGFDCLQALAPEICRPFDRGRSGLMIGEGAAFLVIESEQHALARGAKIRGYVSGYGHTTDTGHLTQPHAEGLPLERAMRTALEKSGMAPESIGYVCAHGTGTPSNDGAEALAYHKVFGGGPTRLSSTKAAVGHTLGAAGAVEAVFCLMALETGLLPPQINLLDPEPIVADALVKPGEKAHLNAAMSVNLGFGGSNAAIVLTKP
jgi:3-oxoacyl-[acyl-carrier-protein] synthase II